MRVAVSKKPKESDERLMARFNKAVQKSKKVYRIRDAKFHKKKSTKRLVRQGAIKRDEYREKREKQKFY
jgi:hypothetical protein